MSYLHGAFGEIWYITLEKKYSYEPFQIILSIGNEACTYKN